MLVVRIPSCQRNSCLLHSRPQQQTHNPTKPNLGNQWVFRIYLQKLGERLLIGTCEGLKQHHQSLYPAWVMDFPLPHRWYFLHFSSLTCILCTHEHCLSLHAVGEALEKHGFRSIWNLNWESDEPIHSLSEGKSTANRFIFAPLPSCDGPLLFPNSLPSTSMDFFF